MSKPWWWDWIELLKAEAQAKLGAAQGDRLIAYLAAWSDVQERIGSAVSLEDYVRLTHARPADAKADHLAFKATFPGFDTPIPLLERLKTAIQRGDVPSLFGLDSDPHPD